MGIKTATITFHNSYNYGSALQAYALQRILNKYGYENEIINYIYSYDSRQYHLFRTHLYKSNPRSFISDLLFIKRNLSRRNKYKKFWRENLKITEEVFHSSKEIEKIIGEYDAFICGSDQIWNPSCTKQVVPAYFLEFAKNTGKLKIAYGPSIAHSYIEDKYKEVFEKKLNNLDKISLREKTGVKLVKELFNKDVIQVLDPTLLLEAKEYENIMSPIEKPGNYVFYYALEPNLTMNKYVLNFLRETGLNIVYYSKKNIYDYRKGLNMYPYGPAEFLYLLKNAKYVITNSFHGTAFSVIFKKKFITFTTKLSYSRMVDFLTLLNLQNRIFTGSTKIDDPIEYELVEKELNKEKAKSLNFLLSNLQRAHCKEGLRNDM